MEGERAAQGLCHPDKDADAVGTSLCLHGFTLAGGPGLTLTQEPIKALCILPR